MARDIDETAMKCEKCGGEVSAEKTSRMVLDDGHVHVFCGMCVKRLLIVKDGSLQF